jgi:two-component system chemotaxis response regulator CheB
MNPFTSSHSPSSDPFYRVMVVDDSAIIRGILTRQLEGDPMIKVVASCSNGQIALDHLVEARPDVILLDIEMPVMDGLTALPLLCARDPNVKIIMASTLTLRNAEVSLQALRKGAHDYIPKPTTTTETMGSTTFQHELIEKVKTWGQKKRGKDQTKSATLTSASQSPQKISLTPLTFKPQIIGIGVSTGGPQALLDILAPLDGICNLPIVITQHMPPRFTTVLAQQLKRASKCDVVEASHSIPLEAGTIYIAPGDYHMVVASKEGKKVIELNQNPHENFCRPAVDPLFTSIAHHYGPKALGFILTGMGSDGTKGSQSIIEAGGHIIAQDEKSSVVWGMPGSVVQAGITKMILPLKDIGQTLKNFVQQKGF